MYTVIEHGLHLSIVKGTTRFFLLIRLVAEWSYYSIARFTNLNRAVFVVQLERDCDGSRLDGWLIGNWRLNSVNRIAIWRYKFFFRRYTWFSLRFAAYYPQERRKGGTCIGRLNFSFNDLLSRTGVDRAFRLKCRNAYEKPAPLLHIH